MKIQQRSWASRLVEVRGDWPCEEPDFAPDPTDPKLLDEIREAEAIKIAREFWDDEDVELDDCGNPIVGNGQLSWAERLEKSSPDESPEVVQALLREPFPSVLLGAALRARQPYLLWNIQTFLNTYLGGNKAWIRYSCGVLINRLRAANGAVIRDSTTTGVLFHLVVEPFALMNELRK